MPHRSKNGHPKNEAGQQASKNLENIINIMTEVHKQNDNVFALIENPRAGSFRKSWEVTKAMTTGPWRLYKTSHCSNRDHELDGPATAANATMWPQKDTVYLAINLPEGADETHLKTCSRDGCMMKNEHNRHIAQIMTPPDNTGDLYKVTKARKAMIPQGEVDCLMRAHEDHLEGKDEAHPWCTVCGKEYKKEGEGSKKGKATTKRKRAEEPQATTSASKPMQGLLVCDEPGCKNAQHQECSHMKAESAEPWYCNHHQMDHNGIHKHHRHAPGINKPKRSQGRATHKHHRHVPKQRAGGKENRH